MSSGTKSMLQAVANFHLFSRIGKSSNASKDKGCGCGGAKNAGKGSRSRGGKHGKESTSGGSDKGSNCCSSSGQTAKGSGSAKTGKRESQHHQPTAAPAPQNVVECSEDAEDGGQGLSHPAPVMMSTMVAPKRESTPVAAGARAPTFSVLAAASSAVRPTPSTTPLNLSTAVHMAPSTIGSDIDASSTYAMHGDALVEDDECYVISHHKAYNHSRGTPLFGSIGSTTASTVRIENDRMTPMSCSDLGVVEDEDEVGGRGGRGGGVRSEQDDVDVVMGFPSATVISYWREKDLKRFSRRSLSNSAEFLAHRRYMVDWVSEVGEELHLQSVTIHTAIAYLDELMHLSACNLNQWRLRAVCCLSVAAKYEEAECNMPMVSELADASELRLTTGAITRGELDLSQRLNWDLSRVTTMHFLGFYLYRGVTFDSDTCQGRPLIEKVVRYTRKYVEFFGNLCQQDVVFQAYPAATVAAASILTARRALSITPLWRKGLEELTQTSQYDIQACGDELWAFYEKMFPEHKPLRSETTSKHHPVIGGGGSSSSNAVVEAIAC